MNIQNIVSIGLGIIKDVPLSGIIWKPRTKITKNFLIYYISMLLLHILPAIFLDTIMKLFGFPPM